MFAPTQHLEHLTQPQSQTSFRARKRRQRLIQPLHLPVTAHADTLTRS
jgi:hypothetical protein